MHDRASESLSSRKLRDDGNPLPSGCADDSAIIAGRAVAQLNPPKPSLGSINGLCTQHVRVGTNVWGEAEGVRKTANVVPDLMPFGISGIVPGHGVTDECAIVPAGDEVATVIDRRTRITLVPNTTDFREAFQYLDLETVAHESRRGDETGGAPPTIAKVSGNDEVILLLIMNGAHGKSIYSDRASLHLRE